MNKKANSFKTLIIILILLLLILGVLLISKNSNNEDSPEILKNECNQDSDCNDDNSCTIDTCRQGECVETKVVLCYQNDGCCPKNCNQRNDNDCTS